jgi:hypothetical protein
MREIKFRAWFTEQNKMFSWEDLINKIGVSRTVFVETDNWKPMQYTGLKDKNGREVYEGDIIDGLFHDYEGPFEIIYFNGCSSVKAVDDYFPCLGEGYRGVEVIGNIYENPELLGKDGG